MYSNPLIISKTDKIPEIILDPPNNKFEINGDFMISPEEEEPLFQTITKWFEYVMQDATYQLIFTFRINYTTKAAARLLMMLIKFLHEKFNQHTFIWEYDDDEYKEHGEELSDILSIPFTFKEVS
mgnify:CR=1 FL=1